MAIRYYDAALVDKIKGWIPQTSDLNVLGPNESTRLFQMKADQNNDKPLTLPFIAISRDPNIEILSTQKKALTYDGVHVAMDEATSVTLNAVPIQINYQLDIYTRYFEEADEYVRNFVFNFINWPELEINIPYNNSNIPHSFTILLEQQISDNSDIPERLISGQFTRMTIRLVIDNAYLFSVPFADNWRVKPGNVEIIDKEI